MTRSRISQSRSLLSFVVKYYDIRGRKVIERQSYQDLKLFNNMKPDTLARRVSPTLQSISHQDMLGIPDLVLSRLLSPHETLIDT